MTDICVRGIFRSGTNFFKSLMEMNYNTRVKYDSYGWKHYFFPAVSNETAVEYPNIPCIFMSRNPYLSLTSLFRYFSSNKRNAHIVSTGSLSEFIRGDISIHDANNKLSPKLWFPNPVVMWAQINFNAITAKNSMPHCADFIRYEDLITDPEASTEEIAEKFSINRTSHSFFIPEKKLKNISENTHNKDRFFSDRDFNRSVIDPNEYMKVYDDQDLSHIRESVPEFIMDELGYAYAGNPLNKERE